MLESNSDVTKDLPRVMLRSVLARRMQGTMYLDDTMVLNCDYTVERIESKEKGVHTIIALLFWWSCRLVESITKTNECRPFLVEG